MSRAVARELAGDTALSHYVAEFEMQGHHAPAQLFTKLREGKFFALVPEETGVERMLQFKLGGLTSPTETIQAGAYVVEGVANLASDLADIVCRDFASQEYSIVVREPYLEQGDDGVLSNGLTLIDHELFKIEQMTTDASVRVTKLISRYTVSWSFLMIVVKAEIKCPTMDELLSAAEMIAVGAYDGESYLYWRKDA